MDSHFTNSKHCEWVPKHKFRGFPNPFYFRGETKMREKIQQINHLAEVLYNESRNRDEISKARAQLLQDILDEMQEQLDSIMNELIAAEQE